MRLCECECCDHLHLARGLCSSHYYRWRVHGTDFDRGSTDRDMKPTRLCDVEGCDRLHTARGLCMEHYHRMRYALKAGFPDDWDRSPIYQATLTGPRRFASRRKKP